MVTATRPAISGVEPGYGSGTAMSGVHNSARVEGLTSLMLIQVMRSVAACASLEREAILDELVGCWCCARERWWAAIVLFHESRAVDLYILRRPGRYAFHKGYRALPKTPKTCLPDQAMPHALPSETRCLSAIYPRVQHGVLAYLRKQGPQA